MAHGAIIPAGRRRATPGMASPRLVVARRAGTGTPQTVVAAFAALAALVLTGQAGLRRDLRAMQTAMLAGLRNEMRAGQARLRQDLAALGVRLSVVEHRTDALETRFAGSERRPAERPVASDSPVAGSDPSASLAGPRSGAAAGHSRSRTGRGQKKPLPEAGRGLEGSVRPPSGDLFERCGTLS